MFWDSCNLDLFSGLERFELVHPSLGLCLSARHFTELLQYFFFIENKRFLCWRKCKDGKGSLVWFIQKEKRGRRFSEMLLWERREQSLFWKSLAQMI